MEKKKVAGKIILTIIGIAVAVILLIGSINNLREKGTYYKGEVTNVTEFFSLKHTVNFIPTGKMYYYIALDADTGEVIVFRASKNFLKKNGNGTTYIEGKVTSLSTKSKEMLRDYDFDYKYGTGKAVNTEIKSYAIQSIAMVVAIIAFCIIGIVNAKTGFLQKSKYFATIYYLLIVVVAVYSIHILTMMDF